MFIDDATDCDMMDILVNSYSNAELPFDIYM